MYGNKQFSYKLSAYLFIHWLDNFQLRISIISDSIPPPATLQICIVGGEDTKKTGLVIDWLKTVNRTKSSSSTKDLLINLGATSGQIYQTTRDKVMSAVTPAPDDFALIPPKHVQFAQPLTSVTMNTSTGNMTTAMDNTKNPSGTSYHHQPMNPSESGPNLKSLISQYEQLGNFTLTNPRLSQINQSLPMYTSTAGQMDSGILPFAPNNSYQPFSMSMPTSIAPNPASIIPHSARSSIIVTQTVQSQVYTPVSHQSTLTATSVVQQQQTNTTVSTHPPFINPISVQQSSTPISYQQSVVPNVIQQPLVSISNQQQPFGSIPVQQFIPISQQPTIPTSVIQSQQFTPRSYQQQQSVPVVSIYQQPIVSYQSTSTIRTKLCSISNVWIKCDIDDAIVSRFKFWTKLECIWSTSTNNRKSRNNIRPSTQQSTVTTKSLTAGSKANDAERLPQV